MNVGSKAVLAAITAACAVLNFFTGHPVIGIVCTVAALGNLYYLVKGE